MNVDAFQRGQYAGSHFWMRCSVPHCPHGANVEPIQGDFERQNLEVKGIWYPEHVGDILEIVLINA